MHTAPTIDTMTRSTQGAKEPELLMLLIGALSAGVMFGVCSIMTGAALLAGGASLVLLSSLRPAAMTP